MPAIRQYIVTGIAVTGTWDNPQEVLYADLTDVNGLSIPSSFETYPGVKITSKSLDVGVYLTEAAGLTSFTIARSDLGVMGGTLTISIEITSQSPSITPEGGDAAWTLRNMIGMLSINLGDDLRGDFTPDMMVRLLNGAQYRTIKRLQIGINDADTKRVSPQIVAELYVTETSLSLDSNASYDLAGLTYEILDGVSGIDRVKITGGEIANKISPDEYRELVKEGFIFNTAKPLYTISKTTLTLLAGSSSANKTLDVSYTRKPLQMALSTDEASDTNCEMEDRLHEIIVGLAGESYRNRSEGALLAFDSAMDMIKGIRANFSESDSVKYGVVHGAPVDIYAGGRTSIYTNR